MKLGLLECTEDVVMFTTRNKAFTKGKFYPCLIHENNAYDLYSKRIVVISNFNQKYKIYDSDDINVSLYKDNFKIVLEGQI